MGYFRGSESEPPSSGNRLLIRSCFPTFGAPTSMQLIVLSCGIVSGSSSLFTTDVSSAFSIIAEGLFFVVVVICSPISVPSSNSSGLRSRQVYQKHIISNKMFGGLRSQNHRVHQELSLQPGSADLQPAPQAISSGS